MLRFINISNELGIFKTIAARQQFPQSYPFVKLLNLDFINKLN